VLDDAHGEAEEAVDLAHPVGVAARQVVVDRDHVDALAFQGVQVGGQGRHQRLALAGLHLGDAAAVEHDAAHELDVERAHVDGPPGGLAGDGKGGDQEVVERGAGFELAAEFHGLRPELLV
jgi:hypothetical protein